MHSHCLTSRSSSVVSLHSNTLFGTIRESGAKLLRRTIWLRVPVYGDLTTLNVANPWSGPWPDAINP